MKEDDKPDEEPLIIKDDNKENEEVLDNQKGNKDDKPIKQLEVDNTEEESEENESNKLLQDKIQFKDDKKKILEDDEGMDCPPKNG